MAFRVNNSNDNYVRFCSSTSAIRTFLNVPTRTGGNASGTWSINVNGNAAYANNAGLLAGSGKSTAANASSIVQRDASGHINMVYGFSSYLNMSHGAENRNADTVFYSSTDGYIRKNTAGSFRTSLNVPTRTGGNASGTWSINVNGNAAYANSAGSATNASYANSAAYANSAINISSSNATMPAYIKHAGDTNTYFGFPGNDTYVIGTSNAERLRVTSGGNVGIGTASPGVQLHIKGRSPIRLTTTNGPSYSDYGQLVITDSTAPSATSVLGNLKIGYDASTGSYGTGFLQTVNPNVYTGPLVLQPYGGNVGIATSNPGYKLDVQGNMYATSYYVYTNVRMSSYVDNLAFYGDAGLNGWIEDDHYNTNALNFTGQHRTFIKDIPHTQTKDYEGFIVSADQNKYIKMSGGIEVGSNAITTNESLPVVSLSTKVNDKKCFGVISTSEDPETRTERYGSFVSVSRKEDGDTRVYINSVGEGAIWVTDINGPLESGDYITTSNVAGYGQRQESEFLANYTVAKITMDCDFNPQTQPVQRILKELANVNYWVKTTYSNVSIEEYSNLAEENRTTTTETVYTNEDGDISVTEYSNLESNVQVTYSEIERIIYRRITKEESKTEQEGWDTEVRQEMVNVLDEHGQLQWEDTDETEKAYKIRYLDTSGTQTDEANAVHIAAFVGCTYHCG
jgi:hypothetical protein